MRAPLARGALLAIALAATITSGCLRRRFDLCAESPPHPECPFDSAVSADAGPADADAAAGDAPSSGEDAALDASAVDAP
jgi:hypothetical protein